MNQSRDGSARHASAGAGRRQVRSTTGIFRSIMYTGTCLALCQALQPTSAVGFGGPASGLVSTIIRVSANRPLSLADGTDDVAGAGAPVVVNQGRRLGLRPETPTDQPSALGDKAPATFGTSIALRDFRDDRSGEEILSLGWFDDDEGRWPPVERLDPPAAPVGRVGEPIGAAASPPEPVRVLALGPAQEPPGSAPERTTAPSGGAAAIIERITGGEEPTQRITVAKNSTVVVDLKSNIDRAEVGDPRVADVIAASPTRLIVTGVGFGTTQVRVWTGPVQTVFEIAVELDLSRLRDLVRMVAPTANVTARSVNGTIVLSGSVSDATTAEKIVQFASLFEGGKVQNQLQVVGLQQTMLRVVVAEVNKEAIRDLGFNWAMGASDLSRDFFFANNLNQINPTVFGSNGLPNVLQGQLLYSVAPTANSPLTNMTFGFPRAEFQMFVNALRENQLFRVLAEPNLVAISGQTATFLAGGEVPIPVTQGGAVAGAIVIEYKEFGVRLAFTPTVQAGQVIRLHVMTEISDAVPGTAIIGGLPVFSFSTRRVESTIECGNGQTFAIAGLLNERIQAIASKLPGLGDLPVLGSLFSSVNYRKSNTEMVVLVTPQLVAAVDPQQVPVAPGALMTPPNDFELFGLQKLEGVPNPRPEYHRVPRDMAPVNVLPGGTSWATTQVTLRGQWGLAEQDDY